MSDKIWAQGQIPPVTAQQAVSLPVSVATDALVAHHVLGWIWDEKTLHWVKPDGSRKLVPRCFSAEISAAWEVVEAMVARMGYDNPSFEWYGPCFKSEHRYLTHEGYPLGTTCWYVRIVTRDWIDMIPADTAPLAVCRASLVVAAIERDPRSDDVVIDWDEVQKAREGQNDVE